MLTSELTKLLSRAINHRTKNPNARPGKLFLELLVRDAQETPKILSAINVPFLLPTRGGK